MTTEIQKLAARMRETAQLKRRIDDRVMLINSRLDRMHPAKERW